MIRTQIQLTQEQARRIKEVAEREGISMAEVIRQAVELWLAAYGDLPREERKRRALGVVGRFHSGLGNVAQNHDYYVAEAMSDYAIHDDIS